MLQALHSAGKVSKTSTQNERRESYIRYSLGNDFREGFRPRDHKADAFSLAQDDLAKARQDAESERRDQEAEYLREAIEAARIFTQAAEGRLAELTADRGSLLFMKRRAEIREASERCRETGII